MKNGQNEINEVSKHVNCPVKYYLVPLRYKDNNRGLFAADSCHEITGCVFVWWSVELLFI